MSSITNSASMKRELLELSYGDNRSSCSVVVNSMVKDVNGII